MTKRFEYCEHEDCGAYVVGCCPLKGCYVEQKYVEVIRCRHCKHWYEWNAWTPKKICHLLYDKSSGIIADEKLPHEFCSDAIRR